MNCPFCDIIQTDRERIIRETPTTFVILSNPRLVPGHLLVIPKRHTEKISELEDPERQELFDGIVEMQKKILSFSAGCDVRQNYRPFLPQDNLKVNHVHFHLIPREFEDDIYTKVQKFERELFQPLLEEERNKFFELLS